VLAYPNAPNTTKTRKLQTKAQKHAREPQMHYRKPLRRPHVDHNQHRRPSMGIGLIVLFDSTMKSDGVPSSRHKVALDVATKASQKGHGDVTLGAPTW
jgi:hypothetical protein